jgi:hypothetical protein
MKINTEQNMVSVKMISRIRIVLVTGRFETRQLHSFVVLEFFLMRCGKFQYLVKIKVLD